MRLLTKQIPFDDFQVVLHGDTHEGCVATSYQSIDKMLDWIMDKPNRYYVHMGDEIEAICTDDKRFQDDTTNEPIPVLQMKQVYARYKVSAARCLVWLKGNHTDALSRFGNLTKMLCEDYLKVPYGTWTCKLRLTDKQGSQICKLYLCHSGFRGQLRSAAKDYEQRLANMKASLKVNLREKAGDCLVMAMGDKHLLLVVDPSTRLIMTDDGDKLQQEYVAAGDGANHYIEPDSRWYLCTGSFRRTFVLGSDDYAERWGINPTEIGYIVLSFRNKKLVKAEKVFCQ